MPERFISLIVAMLPAFNEIEQRLDRDSGRRFNAFNLFDVNEPTTTRILAFLLDPTEAHGQGDIFLRLFIQRFVPDWKDAFVYRMAKRASTNQAIDATITDGVYWLGIENKIFDAQEQPRQAARYLDALKAASDQGRYCLIYLSPRGKPPTDYSLPEEYKATHGANLLCGAWTELGGNDDQEVTPYATITDWLADCRNQCRAENVAWLIRQFTAYVDSMIAGKKEPDMADAAIVKLATGDSKNLEAALRIGQNFDEIRYDVARKLLKCVQGALEDWAREQNEDWEVGVAWPGGNWVEQPGEKWLPLLLRRRAWSPIVGVGLISEKPGLAHVMIGIWGPTQNTWKNDRVSTRYYGEQNTFIGQESRQRIAKSIKMDEQAVQIVDSQSDWWVQHGYNKLSDVDGQEISNWRDISTVARLYSEKEKLCKHIVGQMVKVADTIRDILIDAT